MPQLDFFWWGISFFSCWFFFIFLYIYLVNIKFLLISSNFSLNPENTFNNVLSFFWLW
uniref:ATP synthase F0 subunit 8 n=1 Tax=Comanthus parvicirrus TaxID=1529418 RepID=UPI001EDEA01E|nr:ATP synthase F0 subunit 8 [Comanthus parvicirrus]UFQ22709.1 ATP synthase F0 subunit 8 [Comanthus parvicirrus]UHY39304.1 ATP synthase F0 subunit 8 [Comanthus parvicirrus]